MMDIITNQAKIRQVSRHINLIRGLFHIKALQQNKALSTKAIALFL